MLFRAFERMPRMNRVIIFAAMMLAAGLPVARWAERSGLLATAPGAMAAGRASAPENPSNSRTVTLSRGDDGHFWTDARVDGRRLQLVVDTGASQIALRAADAARLGIHPTPRDYNVKVATANGMTRAALVELGMVEIGNIVVRCFRVRGASEQACRRRDVDPDRA
jgi:aspartyl protease family protein